MTPTIGSTVEWRRGNGKVSRMVVDRIHHVEEEIWLFGWRYTPETSSNTFLYYEDVLALIKEAKTCVFPSDPTEKYYP